MTQQGSAPRLLAFYLPQYHPTPENDAWWGTGFTDWTNVAKARPLFPGHYQPHIPADLGFYDLRVPEVREAQAQLARQYGIHGFCYYHYWFNGQQPLARPLQELLSTGRPDFPFCLCWANENWTRRWDGLDHEVLIRQEYSEVDDLAHIRALLPVLADDRYVRVNNKRLLLIYRTHLMTDPRRTAELWRDIALKEEGIELYLARIERNMETHDDGIDPRTIGFDAAVEFAPDPCATSSPMFHGRKARLLTRVGLLSKAYTEHYVYTYDALIRSMLAKPEPAYRRFSCVTPSWDNSPRRRSGATIFHAADPAKFESWLSTILIQTTSRFAGDERLVFINAWNEWAEGNHLEPDLKHERAYLESTLRATRAVLRCRSDSTTELLVRAKATANPAD